MWYYVVLTFGVVFFSPGTTESRRTIAELTERFQANVCIHMHFCFKLYSHNQCVLFKILNCLTCP